MIETAMNGIEWHAKLWEWQFFATLTFADPVPSQSRKTRMVFAWLREVSSGAGVTTRPTHFKNLEWVLRGELGESSGRHHYHLLIAGLDLGRVNRSECFAQMNLWESLGGGMARVRVFNPRLPGVEYTLKGLEQAPANVGANAYELSKFDDSSVAGRELIVAHRLLGIWGAGATCNGRREARRIVRTSTQRDHVSRRAHSGSWKPTTFPHPADMAGRALVR